MSFRKRIRRHAHERPDPALAYRQPTARLIQEFSGGYHLVVNGKVIEFSTTLAKAQAWAEKHGYELR